MATSSEIVEQLTTALEDLIAVEDAKGSRILYQEDEGGDHSYCRVCDEVDGHKDGCAVGNAEGVLRLLRAR